MKSKASAAIFIVFMMLVSVRGADNNRVIQADLAQIKCSRSMIWQDCVGAGRVYT